MMSLRVWLLTALALHAALAQEGMEEKFAEMMDSLSPEEREQMMRMAAEDEDEDDIGGGGPPRPPKEMTLKKARTMMKELRASLQTASARAALAAVEGEGKERVEVSGPMAEQLALGVLQKYGFEGGEEDGLNEAVRAAMSSGDGDGQHDKKIRSAMEDIEEAIVGRPSAQRLGRRPVLDALASKFLDMDAASRTAAIKEVQGTAGGEVYAEVMAKLVEQGDASIVDQVIEVVNLRGGAAEGQNETDVTVRVNVLREFVRPGDAKLIQQKLEQEDEKPGAEAEAEHDPDLDEEEPLASGKGEDL